MLSASLNYLCFCLDGEKIPNCSEEVLRETSLQSAIDIEKILLSLPPSIRTYPLWIHHDKTTGQKYVWIEFNFFEIQRDAFFSKYI